MKTMLIACLATLVPVATLLAGEFPPEAARPLSEVLTTLESLGLQDPTEVNFDDGRWEIEALRKGVAVEVFVDPQAANVVHERPDDHHAAMPAVAKKLSAIVKQLEEAGDRAIAEIDLDGTTWEVDALRSGVRYELHVDARTGEIVSQGTRRL